jgi:hypothetical protein
LVSGNALDLAAHGANAADFIRCLGERASYFRHSNFKSLQSVNKKSQTGSETAKYPVPQRAAGLRGFHSDTFLIAEWI